MIAFSLQSELYSKLSKTLLLLLIGQRAQKEIEGSLATQQQKSGVFQQKAEEEIKALQDRLQELLEETDGVPETMEELEKRVGIYKTSE